MPSWSSFRSCKCIWAAQQIARAVGLLALHSCRALVDCQSLCRDEQAGPHDPEALSQSASRL